MSVNCILTGQDIQDSYYGICDTQADTSGMLSVAIPNFVLKEGAKITIKFSYTGAVVVKEEAGAPQLNINSSGSKYIYYRGSTIPAS